LILYFHQL